MPHGAGDHHLRGLIDRERRELRRILQRLIKRFLHRIAGGIETETAAEIDANRVRPAFIDNRPQLRGNIVDRLVPAHAHQFAILAHERMRDGVGAVMHAIGRAPLRTRIALRDWMVAIAADLDDLFADDIGNDAAMRNAHPAIGAFLLDRLTGRHGRPPPPIE